jgi:hypothetical protein
VGGCYALSWIEAREGLKLSNRQITPITQNNLAPNMTALKSRKPVLALGGGGTTIFVSRQRGIPGPSGHLRMAVLEFGCEGLGALRHSLAVLCCERRSSRHRLGEVTKGVFGLPKCPDGEEGCGPFQRGRPALA